jgi:AraC-like DNA-binding protein
MNTNFYKLINGYRIQHAISLIEDNSIHWPLERIAFESGFANRVTFSKAFKEIMGQTASEYKKQLQNVG